MQNKINSEEIRKLNSDILEKTSDIKNTVDNELRTSFYFKGRKSEKIAKNIIELLSEKNDKILDPFFGGGSFILSSLLAGRYITGIELDNYTYDIISTLLTKMDESVISMYFKTIEDNAKEKVMNLYRTKCCGEKNYIKKILFDPENEEYYRPMKNREIIDDKNIILMNTCPVCGEMRKQFDKYDETVLNESFKFDNSSFPTDNYIENSRINITKSTGADRYDRIFSERNKHALLIIQNEISKLPESDEKKFIQHALVSSLALSKISMYGSSTDILYHVITQKGQDMNVWHLFESKYNAMLKFRKKYNNFLVDDIQNNSLMGLYNNSYDVFLNNCNTKFDLIYTDFPYTDQVPYLERNQLFRKWLEHFYDNNSFKLTNEMLTKEIVLTNAPSRPSKNKLSTYYNDLDNMFSVFSDVLKDNKFLVFTMKLGQKIYIRTYSEIINLARKNGFEYVTRINVEKNDPTLRKQSAYANTFMNEVVVIFKKLPDSIKYWYEGNLNYEYIGTKLIYEHISRQPDKTTSLTQAVQLLMNDLSSKGFCVSKEKNQLAKNLVINNFVVDKGFVYIDENKLYLDIEDNMTLFAKLYDLIPIYIKKLFEENGKFVLEDLYLHLTSSLGSGNSNTLAQLLEDENYHNQISLLLNNYCDIENGYYVEKKIDNFASIDKTDISQYSGSEFEELIKNLLEKEGYINPVVMGGAGDRGVDIIASIMIDKNMEKHLFQCKRWISNVGSEPIQRLYAEREYGNYDKAFCVTTSGYTKEGKNALQRFNVEGWTGWDVQEKLNKHFPNKYFNRALDLSQKVKNI